MQDIAQKHIFFLKTTRAGSGSGFGGDISGSGSGKKVRIRIRNTGKNYETGTRKRGKI
jgi:hypothetical protein